MKVFWSLPFLALLVWGEVCAEKEIVIIGTTDVHGRLTPVDYYSGTGLPGSLARVHTLVKGLRAENPYTLLVDSGDLLQGSPLEEIYLRGVVMGEDPAAKVTNFMGYDAVVVGNHDLDFGLDALFSVAKQCRYPWLAANIHRADTGERPFQTHVVKDVAGVRVAVIGLTNQGPAVWAQGGLRRRLLFVDPVEEARVLVPEIRNEGGVDLVVVLAHGGVGESPWAPTYDGYAPQSGLGPENFAARLAREVAGIDVVLAGHTHEEVASQWVDDCLLVQSGMGAAKVAVVRVTVEGEDDRTTIGGKRAELLSTRGTAPSEEILALVMEDEDLVYSHLAEPLGLVSTPLDAASCRVKDNAVVDLIHKVQLLESGAQVSAAACFVEDFRLPAGEVNLADLHSVYPYANTLVAVEMTGGEIKDYLECAASYFPTYDFSGRDPEHEPLFPGYQYDTLEGVEYELDITRPAGKRLTRLLYRGRPLRRDALLKVALSSYRRGGGGGYSGVARAPLVYDRQQDIPSLLADYVRRVGLLQPVATANWHLVPDYLAHWAREKVDYLYRTGLVEGRAGVFRPQEPATTREVVEWLAGTHGGRKRVRKRFQAMADSLQLDWDGGLARLEALRLLFACLVPETSACREYGWRLRDWDNLAAGDRVVTGTAVARGWLVDTPWEVVDTLGLVTRGEAASVVFGTRFRELTFAATNDLHGGLEGRMTPGPRATELGGIARIGGLVDSLRHANPGGVVLLDVGDLMQGTLVSNTYHGVPVIEAFNLMGYDAAALGNHEFDWGQDVLRERIGEAHFPLLSANTVLVDSGVPPPWIEPSALLERADLQVGVVGLSPPEMPYIVKASHLAGLAFLEPAEPAQREVNRLRDAGADVVIVAAHIGVDRTESGGWTGPALDLAEDLEDADILFSGHSHSLLDTTMADCPVVQGLCCGQAVAIGEIVYDMQERAVVTRRAHVVGRLDGAKSAALDSLVAHYKALIVEQAGRVVARLAQPMMRQPSSAGEMALGDLIADAQRAATGAQIAMMNAGGIRADLPEGEVTWEMLYAVQPFGNTLVLLEMTGAQVLEALEQGVSSSGRVVQVSGLSFSLDREAPVGARVKEVSLEDGKSLSMTEAYTVVVNDFMWWGGDRFTVFQEALRAEDTYTIDVTAFEDHLASLRQPVRYELQNRIHLLGD